ncbi:MAG: helix-turn-helix domain-containing protein [Nitrosopumilaceae archaeon]|nr:Crp/Fnr family transcriptional regulator [Nitrosopumilaceae archaeon]NIU01649.1 Crp/Fnr family transcriptional regulator [Nitrosopumilaceae archaeon]NIU88064.1 helix-turn-helix domain-containing protein [Nitrosopumilaceae archaeon]NIV67209.1 helix-turn-helix domain-containing protein [Nitrosopumilaceae archaeon]NIX62251.1 helix-turn-helix domain-containing protein [Nitrosopumilaceae archaeon]
MDLKKFEIFENFSKAELNSVHKILQLNEFKKGAPIAVLPTETVYFLIKGKAKFSRIDEKGKEIILYILRAGETFGLPDFSNGKYSNSLVVALNKCLVGRIHQADFDKLLEKKPDLCLAVNKQVGTRLVKIENRFEELLFCDIPCRLARLLLRLSDEYSHELDSGVCIDVILTRQELANLIGASREKTSLTLSHFHRNGLVKFHQRYICLHDVLALKNMAK